MTKIRAVFALLAVTLLVLMPFVAGCLTVPGPESTKKTTPVTAAVTRSPQTTSPAITAAQSPVVTPFPATHAISQTSYASGTCTDLKGYLVSPGQQCNGAWITATNTFSCCSVPPVKAGHDNNTVSVAAFTLTVNSDDSLGDISS